MLWAGPIEFSTGEIIAILLVMAAVALVLPALGGLLAVLLYRRNTPAPQRTRREATVLFFRTGAIVLLGQVVVGVLIGWLQELIG
jgi:uncharacterized membrane protein